MAKLLALLVIALVCVFVNVQGQEIEKKSAVIGQTFGEIIVSSDLNVRRKSKENRQGKKLLTNVPSGTTGPPNKPTEITSRLVSSDGSRIALEKRERRDITMKQWHDLGAAGYLLKYRKR